MTYENAVKIIANSDKTIADRGQIIIKEMNRLSSDIIDYDYTDKHYKGSGSVLTDKVQTIKKSLAVLLSEIDVYMQMLNITDSVKNNAERRVNRIAERIQND